MLQTGQRQVNIVPQTVKEPVQKPSRSALLKARPQTLLAVPVATLITLAVHLCLPNNELPNEAHLYSQFLTGVLGVAVVAGMVQFFWRCLRRWMRNMCPIFAAAILTLCAWELITGILRW